MDPQKQARDYVWELTGGERGGVRGKRGEKMEGYYYYYYPYYY